MSQLVGRGCAFATSAIPDLIQNAQLARNFPGEENSLTSTRGKNVQEEAASIGSSGLCKSEGRHCTELHPSIFIFFDRGYNFLRNISLYTIQPLQHPSVRDAQEQLAAWQDEAKFAEAFSLQLQAGSAIHLWTRCSAAPSTRRRAHGLPYLSMSLFFRVGQDLTPLSCSVWR